MESYLKRNYNGDLMDLLDCFSPTNSFRIQIDNKKLDRFIDPFYYNNICHNNCTDCNYCSSYLKNCVNMQELYEVNKLSWEFYKSIDSFNNNIKKVMEN